MQLRGEGLYPGDVEDLQLVSLTKAEHQLTGKVIAEDPVQDAMPTLECAIAALDSCPDPISSVCLQARIRTLESIHEFPLAGIIW
jgi:hypothetical protein